MKKQIFGVLLVLTFCSIMVFAGFVERAHGTSKTWIVSKDGTGDFTIIQSALDAATSGDIVEVKVGVYYEHVVIAKTLTLLGENKQTVIIDGGGTGTFTNVRVSADNVKISGFTIQHSIDVGNAIWVESNDATITNNIITNNGDGIRIYISHGNTISNNLVKNNPFTGIGFDWAYDNLVTGNEVSNNYIGIGAGNPSYDNVFSDNSITDNSYGFSIAMYNCKFFHNNILNNNIQASYYGGTYVNTWDNGYPSGGNFWSDYTGVDSNGDGIGDTPYIINANNKDNYPLMKTLLFVVPEYAFGGIIALTACFAAFGIFRLRGKSKRLSKI